jgi:hypothetical protein
LNIIPRLLSFLSPPLRPTTFIRFQTFLIIEI